jgi:amino acid transporter
MLIIITIVILTFFICFSISHIFLSVFLYEDKKELKNFKNDIFSYIFGLSNILLVLIVLEIADVDDFQ